jgi:hypothetical protein
MGSTAAAGGRTCAKRHTLVSTVPDTLELMYINRPADELSSCVEPQLTLRPLPEHEVTRTVAAARRPAGIHRLMLGIAAMAFAAGCGSNSPTTLSPTPSSATVTSVIVTAVSPLASSFQAIATAHFSDNTTRDVTSGAQWASSNPSAATVASTGMVTVVGSGDVELRATYQTVTGSLRLAVVWAPRPAVALSGVVREVAPNEHAVAGARVDIVAGLDAGKFVLSDQNGNYQFTGITQGTVRVTATMTGYQVWQSNDITLTADAKEDAWLVLIPPKDASGVTATARCKDGTWSWSTDPVAACAANGGTAYVVCPGPLCPNSRLK